jgi:hypothetical protein
MLAYTYILVLPESETKPGGFLRGKSSAAPLNSTGYTALTPNRILFSIFFKNQYLQVRAVYAALFRPFFTPDLTKI